MTPKVTLTIDNQTVTVPEGTLVVDAAKLIGIDIPVFCYHPKMAPVGMCRMCLVDVGRPVIDRATGQPVLDDDGNPVINFNPKLETGCTVTVSEGMVVHGKTDNVQEARNEVIEFILTSHPLDCPVCDKGGECPLQNLTMHFGPGTSRFVFDDKIHFSKNIPLGDLIYLDRERCIQCARCTRFQDEIADDPVIGFFNRGRRLEIITFSDPGFDSYWSGNTTDICPVGALTTADFRFGARPWELNSAASICNQCPVGCNITFNTRREVKSGGGFAIKRAMPRQNEAVNEIWLCDKGRFSSYTLGESDKRISQPMIRVDGDLKPVEWGAALDYIAENLGALEGSLLSVASGRLSNEDLYNLRKFTTHLNGETALYTHLAGGDLVTRVGLSQGSNLGDLGKGDAILVVASDLEEEAPVWWLRVKQAAERGATVVVANPRSTKLDRAATHKLRYIYGQELTVLDRLPEDFTKSENTVIFYGSEGLGLAGSAKLAEGLAGWLVNTGRSGKANNGLVAVHPRANDQGAWELGYRPNADLAASMAKSAALYIAGADPLGDTGMEAPEAFMIVQDVIMTRTAEAADVVLPASTFTERDGSYTSGERRVQRFYATVPALPGTRPDFTITAQIAVRFGLEIEGRFAPRIFSALAEEVESYSGLTYVAISRTEEQWPIVGRSDMYYGGTTYENSLGLGVQLPAGDGSFEGAWKAPSGKEVSGLTAVPVTVLYDQGSVISQSKTLAPRLAQPHVIVSASDAGGLGLENDSIASVQVNGREIELSVRLDESVPAGFVLVPRSMGLNLEAPAPVKVRVLEKELA